MMLFSFEMQRNEWRQMHYVIETRSYKPGFVQKTVVSFLSYYFPSFKNGWNLGEWDVNATSNFLLQVRS